MLIVRDQKYQPADFIRAVQLWGEVAKSPAKAYRSLALMQLGGAKMAAGKSDDVKAAVTTAVCWAKACWVACWTAGAFWAAAGFAAMIAGIAAATID